MQQIAFKHNLPSATSDGGSASGQVSGSGEGTVGKAHEVGDIGLRWGEDGVRLIEAVSDDIWSMSRKSNIAREYSRHVAAYLQASSPSRPPLL